jgi:hypothetical protein
MKKFKPLMFHVLNNNLGDVIIGLNAYFQMLLHQAESREPLECADIEELKNWAETIVNTCDEVIDAMNAGGSK